MSPPLVVAFALTGRIDVDLSTDPLGTGSDGRPVYLRDIWPARAEIEEVLNRCVQSEMFRKNYAAVYEGDEAWRALEVPEGDRFAWDPESTYVRRPPYFDGMERQPPARVDDISGLRVFAILGDSVTTDHISPAGSIKKDSPAGEHLVAKGVSPADFNSYGARRGNHEVMVRGTFANSRIKNRMAPGREGGFTTYLPTGEVTTLYDAAMRYRAAGIPLIVLAGKEYGSGSSRDWAAKGPMLQGIRVVIAESYERIHRSNLVGMGILPLQFADGESAASLGLEGAETFEVRGLSSAIASAFAQGRDLQVRARRTNGTERVFTATIRIDTPQEILYYRHGGILPFVLRQLLLGRERIEGPPDMATAAPPPEPVKAQGASDSFPASDVPSH